MAESFGEENEEDTIENGSHTYIQRVSNGHKKTYTTMIVCRNQRIEEGEKVFLSTDIRPLMTDSEDEETSSHHHKS